jgi:hypothetical protein
MAAVAVDMEAADMAVAVAVMAVESSLLLSSQDTTLNTDMFLQVEVSTRPPSKSEQTLSRSTFFSDHLRVT